MSNLFILLFLFSLASFLIGMVNPKIFAYFLKKQTNRKGVAKIFGVATIIFFILIGVTANKDRLELKKDVSHADQKVVEQVEFVDKKIVEQIKPVDYKIVKAEDQSHKALGDKSLSDYTVQELDSLPTDKKMSYRVVVPSEIKKNQVEPTIAAIISEITSHDDDIDEISLLLYSDEKLTSGAYDVAMATWAPEGKLGNVTSEIAEKNDRRNYATSIQIKENLEEYLAQRGKTEDKFGFSEEERRQIFSELLAAEHRATNEAEEIYPLDVSNPNYRQENFGKNIDKVRELMDKYRLEVRTRYGITEDVQVSIIIEAVQEGWF